MQKPLKNCAAKIQKDLYSLHQGVRPVPLPKVANGLTLTYFLDDSIILETTPFQTPQSTQSNILSRNSITSPKLEASFESPLASPKAKRQ